MHPELFRIPGTNFMVPSYGAMIVIAFLGGTWWMSRRAAKVKADPDVVLSLALIALIFGWLGGRTFYVIHYWKTQFAHQPWEIINFNAGGFEVYGGLMTAAFCCMVYLWTRGLSIRLYADMAAPTVLFGMGVGRIGCYLVGCCWGATCSPSMPLAVQFPALSSAAQQHWDERLLALPAELIIVDSAGISMPMPRQLLAMKPADLERMEQRYREAQKTLQDPETSGNPYKAGRARAVISAIGAVKDHLQLHDTNFEGLRDLASLPEFRSRHVHPAQLYSAVGPLLLALLTSAYFYRRKRHGTVMLMAVVLYAIERFIEEFLRSDNPQDTFGLTISQGVSIGFLVFAALWWSILRNQPLRSPKPARPLPKGGASAEPTPSPAT